MSNEPMKVTGDFVTKALRYVYKEDGPDEALAVGRKTLVGATDVQILRIAKGEARLEGVTPNITYVEGGGQS